MLDESFFVYENYLAVLNLGSAPALELAYDRDDFADEGDHARS